MTSDLHSTSDSVSTTNSGSPWPPRIGWGVFLTLYTVFAVTTVATMRTGMQDDPEKFNPDAGPRPYPPFLGFDDWPLAVSLSAIPMAIGLVSLLVWLSWRRRRAHWAVIIAFAGLIAGALDPLANWATFAIFDPRMLHFPHSWPYVSISPNLEPALAFLGGYAAYYLLNGLGFLKLHDRLIHPLMRRSRWLMNHRLVAVFIGAGVLAIPMNALIQITWMQAGIFFYTEAVGPVLRIGHVHFPLIMAIYDAFIFALVAVMCVRDDADELVLITRIGRWLPVRRGRSPMTLTRQMLVATAISLLSFGIPLAMLAGMREAGLSRPSYDKNPYPTVKVYDPYGHLEEAGKPGPFFR